MNLQYDKFNNLLHIRLMEDTKGYEKILVYVTKGIFEDSSLLYEGKALENLIIPFSTNMYDNREVIIIGEKEGQRKEIARQALRGGSNNFNPIIMQEIAKLKLQRKRRIDIVGEYVTIFILQSNSQKCSCWDPVYNAPNPNCKICHGTGYINKYYAIETKIEINDTITDNRTQESTGKELRKQAPNNFMLDFPYVQNGDIVLRGNGLAYVIDNKKDEFLKGIELIGQYFDLVLYPDWYPLEFSKHEKIKLKRN